MEVPISKNYFSNFNKPSQGDPCVICGKGITGGAQYLIVDITTNELVKPDEYYTALEHGEEWAEMDVAEEPVGSYCVKQNPEVKPYLV